MTTATTTDKSIRYDRASRDWAAYLNGEYIGSFSTHAAAEAALDQVAYDQLADGVALTAAELDGGSDADTMAEEVAAAVVAPDALTVDQALTLLAAINTAHRNGLDVSGMRGWLSSHGHATVLDASGAYRLAAPRCPYCDDTGLIPNGSGTGDASGGWADTCECQDPEPPAPTPAPAPAPQPPYGPQRPFPLTDTAELAAELSAVEGLDLGVACALAAAHLGHITREAGRAPLHCRVCGSDTHLTSACPVAPAPARGYVTRLRRDLGW